MTDIYQLLADELCENCAAATEDCQQGCWNGESKCRFYGDMEELEARSKVLMDWFALVVRSAHRYDESEDELAFLNI